MANSESQIANRKSANSECEKVRSDDFSRSSRLAGKFVVATSVA